MPRPRRIEDAVQVAIRMPQAWVDRAEAIAKKRSRKGASVSRTDILRMAVYRGLRGVR
jgi:hypothetical protein